jgi:CBS domain-containing protein
LEHALTVDVSRDPDDLREFLTTVAPLDALSPAELATVAAAAVVRDYSIGDLVVDAFAERTRNVYVVIAGEVALRTNPDLVNDVEQDRFGPGALIGFSSMLTDRPVGPRVVATAASRVAAIDADLVESAFYSRSGARFLAEYISHIRRQAVELPRFGRVADLISSDPVTVAGDAPVAEAAIRMTERGLPCAVVDLGAGEFGMLSDSGLRREVIAARRSLDTHAREVMQYPAPMVPLESTAEEALIEMLDRSAEFLVVADRAGTVRGVVGPRDFVLSPATAGVSLHERIREATTVEDLAARARTTPAMLVDILARGLSPDRVVAVNSAIVDAVVRRAIGLVFDTHPELSVDAFTWLSLGSNGRREAVLSSDVDAAVAFDDSLDDAEMDRYRAAFGEVNAILVRSGIGVDDHGAFPSRAPFARTNRQWLKAAHAWLSVPEQNQGVIMASLLVDGRPIHGDPGLPTVTRVFTDFRRHPSTMKLLLAESLARRAKFRSLKDVLTGKGDTFDVKAYGLAPVVNVARWAALGVGVADLQTVDRLRAASGSEILPRRHAELLIEAFEELQALRLRHQLAQVNRGETPTDIVARDELSPIERSMIAQSVRQITTTQRRMDRVGQYVAPETWAVRTAKRR